MRVIVGTVVVLGFAVTVAVGQPPRERAAVLKPPQAIPPDELQLVARGTAVDFPAPADLPSTPVTRPSFPATYVPAAGHAPNTGGPAWLSGVDPNVLPAGAGLGAKTSVRPLSPTGSGAIPKDDPSFLAKGREKLKGALSGTMPAVYQQPQPQPQSVSPHPPVSQQPMPTASTPFRGTAANGAPVYAGPPAYRWYGWGSVTPGANPMAPTGEYPKASANWYSITGATPGAFPVPVMNPLRPAPGAEPPAYAAGRPRVPTQPAVASGPTRPEETEMPRYAPPSESKFVGGPAAPAQPSAPPSAPQVPWRDPISPPAPAPVATTLPAVPPTPAFEPMQPLAPALPPKPVPVGSPSPLPTSVTEPPQFEETQWQAPNQPTQVAPGTWGPAGGTPSPEPAPPADPPPNWSGRAPVRPIVARGQVSDNNSDPIAALIRQMCQGRATGVEVRKASQKKLIVCFEIRGAAEAQKLVAEISKRPELTAYQIDFCVVVK